MNRIYRKVWNKSLNQLVVASELASGDSAGVRAADVVLRGYGMRAATLGLALAGALLAPAAMGQSVSVGENRNCLVLDTSLLARCAAAGSAMVAFPAPSAAAVAFSDSFDGTGSTGPGGVSTRVRVSAMIT